MNAITTTSPEREWCDGKSHGASVMTRVMLCGEPYVITYTGQAEQVRRWHSACVPAGLVSRWLALPASFADTVRVGVVG